MGRLTGWLRDVVLRVHADSVHRIQLRKLSLRLGILADMDGANTSIPQLIDAYSTAAADCFVITTSLGSVLAFAWTLVVSDWAHDRGPAEPFGIFGMLMGLFGLLNVPLWFFGKRIRIATASFMAQ